MKQNIPHRLDAALSKLYAAFTKGELNPQCCTACAVGNICDQIDAWKHFTDAHGSTKLNYVGQVNEAFGKRINGYLPSELLKTEAVFLEACGFELPIRRGNFKPDQFTNQTLFEGLCAVISYLCALDNVTDVMNYTAVFEREIDNAYVLV
ncbi:Na(+)-translocating NADH-quinone reductase subunit F [Dokdonia sinensis]|uniref:Na(+)-translocating NADH-quinone reductase subunit F n=1 Tax=Dokdonia sinensis TaxID=2479847 RepID=A0A3M0FUI9_9FLAO|nr:Na(+)-translocating NADH-quinone reductase subunit F [Dokdonia sinensis]RMB56178.1 Na(+)-translocating NADH-quinone reductase subunit F [Dokdonia sinensis]